MGPGQQRADVYANVSRIVAAARALFPVEGASVTLAEVARRAGVGIATLYRHFPNRQALALAVYETVFQAEIAPLIDKFQQSGTPREELLDLIERLTGILHQQWGLISSLDDVTAVTASLLSSNDEAFAVMVARAQAAGNLRDDLTANDLLPILAMLATALSAVDPDAAARRRYLSMLLDGLNPEHAGPLPTPSGRRAQARSAARR